jgi:hypothetical protein
MNRTSAAVAGVAVVLVTGVSGCAQPEISGKQNASVTINGRDQGKTEDVRCTQQETTWFVDIRQVASTVSAIVEVKGDEAIPQTVDIRGFGGFTGGYWEGGQTTANANLANHTFTIAGTAYGLMAGNPQAGPAQFKIVARC